MDGDEIGDVCDPDSDGDGELVWDEMRWGGAWWQVTVEQGWYGSEAGWDRVEMAEVQDDIGAG